MAKIKKIRCNGTLYEQSEISSGCMPKMAKQQRAKRSQITSEGKKIINAVESKLSMMRYICLNFVSGRDLKAELTYAGIEPTSKQAADYLKAFHAAMREFYRKLGYEYKYIAVTEHHGKDGEPARVHHHLITVISFVFACFNYAIVKPLQRSIDKLEIVLDKLQEQWKKDSDRITAVEQSAKSAHHRIDEIREELNHEN